MHNESKCILYIVSLNLLKRSMSASFSCSLDENPSFSLLLPATTLTVTARSIPDGFSVQGQLFTIFVLLKDLVCGCAHLVNTVQHVAPVLEWNLNTPMIQALMPSYTTNFLCKYIFFSLQQINVYDREG